MITDKIWVGDYVQLSAGEAPPQDWAFAFESIEPNESECLVMCVHGYKKIARSDLYPMESEAFKRWARGKVIEAMNNSRSLADIWNDPRFPA